MPIRSASDTKFLYYPVFYRVLQHSADGGKTLPTRVVSSTKGPFDFSSAALPAAVTLQVKTDNGAWLNKTINLSAPAPAGGISSVTAAELVTAITAASVTGWTASVEAVTSLLKMALTSPGTSKYVQIRGEVADITGMRAQIFKGDTQKSVAVTPTIVEAERLETMDSLGKKTTVIAGAYRTGCVPIIEDTAMSKELRAAIEGGLLTVIAGYTAKQYAAPGADTIQPIVGIESFFAMFSKNDNQATLPVGYLWLRHDSCKGVFGALTGVRNAQTWTYTFDAVPYRDPVTGNVDATDEYSQELTTSEYAALDVFNV
jgi:hypothetical protein